jgi:hypothetical protein
MPDKFELTDNAFVDGFLDKSFAETVLRRLTRKVKCKLPGNQSAKIIDTDENLIIDMAQQGGLLYLNVSGTPVLYRVIMGIEING